MKKAILLSILFVCLCTAVWAQPRPGGWPTQQNAFLYEGIYTETGRFYINNALSNQYVVSTSFYVKIFSDTMVVTAFSSEQGCAIDTEYKYTGDKDGNRIYSLPNGMQYFLVDKNYDIMRVMEFFSMLYGANVKDHYYYETVKGEHADEYNKKHHTDIDSMREQLYGY